MDKNEIRYSALLEEYRCLKSEIAANLASSRQATNLTLVALGLVASGAKILADAGAYWPLLLGPPVFVALVLTQLRYTHLAVEMGRYIERRIAPEIRRLAEASEVMGWEASRSESFSKMRWLPIRGATLALPLLGAMLCVILYLGIHFRSVGSGSLWPLDAPSILGLAVLFLVLGTVIYCFVAGKALERARHSRSAGTGGEARLEKPEDRPAPSTGS